MNNKPLISVIMNCYNGGKYLEESINSLVNQTYQNWELIFWDNLSTDNSYEIFNKFNDKRLKYFRSTKHVILYQARNLALQKTNGDFIAFLDTDDIWLPNKLEKQVPLFNNPKIGLVYGNFWNYNEKKFFSKKKIVRKNILKRGKITQHLIKNYYIGILTVIIRKEFINNLKEVFNTKYNLLADFDFILKFSLKHEFDFIEEPVAIYRQHEKQLQYLEIEKQADQLCAWYEKTQSSKIFGSDNQLSWVKNKCEFLKIIKDIKQKKFSKSFSNILKYPNNINKIKLILIFLLPEKIITRLISFT